MWVLWTTAALRLVRREPAPFAVPLDNYAGSQYLMNITVGGQPLTVIPDSGSFGLLVTSTRCTACPQQALEVDALQPELYASREEQSWVSFGSGNVTLQLASAQVHVADVQAEAAIWEIVGNDASMAALWRAARFEGILGLGYADVDKDRTTVMTALGIDTFAFCLGTTLWAPGRLHFGTTLPEQEQHFATVLPNDHGHWLLQMHDVVGLCPADGPECVALVDSGTSQVMIPLVHVPNFLKTIGEVKTDCSNYAELPDVTFRLGGPDAPVLNLPKEAYVRKLTAGGIKTAMGIDKETNDITWETTPVVEVCRLSVGSAALKGDARPVWILGMPFFRAHLVSFDRARRRVGVSARPCESAPVDTAHHSVALQRGRAAAAAAVAADASDAVGGADAEVYVRSMQGARPGPVRPAAWDVVSPGLVLEGRAALSLAFERGRLS